ncbi:hypothetical protein CXR29_11580 [Brevibacterium linens]|nr:hypothetical protein CXR29_11580 [Brevibacterium linens]
MGACNPVVHGRVTREDHPCGRTLSIHKAPTFESHASPQEAVVECTETTVIRLLTTIGTVRSGARLAERSTPVDARVDAMIRIGGPPRRGIDRDWK